MAQEDINASACSKGSACCGRDKDTLTESSKPCCAHSDSKSRPCCGGDKDDFTNPSDSCCNSKNKTHQMNPSDLSAKIDASCCGGVTGKGDKPEESSVVCVAVVRHNGNDVVLVDSTGRSRNFTYKGDKKNKNKLCFSTHGHDGIDDLLTPCFDEEGKHGSPDEGCFCGIDTPHIHAHMHDPLKCIDKEPATGCSIKNTHKNEEIGFEYLSQLTLHPTDDYDDETFHENIETGVPLVNLPISDTLPKQCNSRKLHRKLSDHGFDPLHAHKSIRRRRISRIRHDDHIDYLVHNQETGDLQLEHPCHDCGDDDLHGKFHFVGKRLVSDDNDVQLHFFEDAPVPFNILDYFTHVFNPNTERVLVARGNVSCCEQECCGPSAVASDKAIMSSCCTNGRCHASIENQSIEEITPCLKDCCNNVDGELNKLEGPASCVKGCCSSVYQPIPVVSDKGVISKFHCKRMAGSSDVSVIKSVLEIIEGVNNIDVDVIAKDVRVDHDPAIVKVDDIVSALNGNRLSAKVIYNGEEDKLVVGGGVKSHKGRSKFFVERVCCASEIPAIQSIVGPLPTVSNVSINVTTKLVYVDHDTTVTSADNICDALNANRFGARIEHDAADDKKASDISAFVKSTFSVESPADTMKTKEVLLEEFIADFDTSLVKSHDLDECNVTICHNPYLLMAPDIAEAITEGTGLHTILIKDGAADFDAPEAKEERHVEDTTLRLRPAVILSGICWVISMLSYIGGNWDYLKYVGLLSVAFGIPSIAVKAFQTLRRYQFDANCLMLFASLGAVALQEYAEAAAVTFLFSISEWLEVQATARARNALSEIVHLRPERANLVHPVTREIVVINASAVPVGALVMVRFGDKIPCDGIVFEGNSTVDESSLTGESRPIRKAVDDIVSGGTVNNGLTPLMVRTTSTVENSAVARLIRLVEEAQANRSPTEKLVDEFAKRYTPLVVLAAICMVSIPWAFGRETGREWTEYGLILIVIACPCALIISTPVSYVAGLAATAQRGIVIKGGTHLEALGMVKNIAFDKTGTLTEGNFALISLDVIGDRRTREEILQYLWKIEEKAPHPLAQALVTAAKNEKVPMPKRLPLNKHTNLDGEGVSALVGDKNVYVGNERLFRRLGYYQMLSTKDKETADEWAALGRTVGFMGIEGEGIVCLYCVADVVRSESQEVVATLNKMGIEVSLLTGDGKDAAFAIGKQVGLSEDEIKSQLLPADKLALVDEMKEKAAVGRFSILNPCCSRQTVLFCGDGVNDAPAMASANVGVAMGAGAALAMETSDVTLLDSHLTKLVYSIKMGRRVKRKIIENVVFSIVVKAIVVGFTFAGRAQLWAAIASDVGAMLAVTLNAMRLLPSRRSKHRLANIAGAAASSEV